MGGGGGGGWVEILEECKGMDKWIKSFESVRQLIFLSSFFSCQVKGMLSLPLCPGGHRVPGGGGGGGARGWPGFWLHAALK